MGQMGKWPWQCTTTGLDNSIELWMEKIRQAVTEIWVPQVWQPPAHPPARTVTTIPLQPEGLRGKKKHAIFNIDDLEQGCSISSVWARILFTRERKGFHCHVVIMTTIRCTNVTLRSNTWMVDSVLFPDGMTPGLTAVSHTATWPFSLTIRAPRLSEPPSMVHATFPEMKQDKLYSKSVQS